MRDKPFMGSPVYIIAFVIVYLLISKYLPEYMRSRKAKYFKIKHALLVFDAYAAVASIYLLTKLVKYMIWSNYDFRCMGLDLSYRNETLEVKILNLFSENLSSDQKMFEMFKQIIETQYQWFLLKSTYPVESVILYLGGQFQIVFFYIIYHHATLPLLAWIALKFYPGGHSVFFVFANSLTHSIMFSFLFFMNIFPKLKEFNWQAFLSGLNIAQMIAILIHGCQLFFYNPCDYPMLLVWIFAIWGISILIVFLLTWPWLTKKRERILDMELEREALKVAMLDVKDEKVH